MADEKKPATIPGGVVAIVILMMIFVPGIFNAFASILGGFGAAINMQAQRAPGFIIILIIIMIFAFRKKKD